MEQLYYSKKDNILFFISGYPFESSNVMGIIEELKNGRNYFIKLCGLDKSAQVETEIVTHSRRYKQMRVYYIRECKMPPNNAFKLGEDWTMDKWITS